MLTQRRNNETSSCSGGRGYSRWRVEHLFLLVPAQQYVGQFIATFKEFPPSQKPGSFSIDAALAKLQDGATNR